MSPASRATLLPADGLAVGGTDMVRSRLTMAAPADTDAKLQGAKQRLYVLGQLGGWGLFFALQLFIAKALEKPATSRPFSEVVSSATMIVFSGILLTHFARGPMLRWGWHDLGWRSLFWRIPVMAMVLSFLWIAFGYGWTFGVLREAWPKEVAPPLLFFISWLNGTILLTAWLCIYFFYHVLERLQRMQIEQLRLSANAKEAELRALKSQVNPHFLFNSLNSLRALIDEDAPRARESVTRLANMLRYSLQSGQLETVAFDEELRTVEDYLALEQIRHEDRLRVSWRISDAARGVAVPPMLLQTLVENAVKYGISPRRDGGDIEISASVEGDDLHIRVRNPGDLTSPASPAAAKAGSSTGVGLKNASERLTLLFGQRARLNVVAESAGTVTAHVLIPTEAGR
jgi:hypothetical protein